MLDAIITWVEDGRAPEGIVATGDFIPADPGHCAPTHSRAHYQGGDAPAVRRALTHIYLVVRSAPVARHM